jgi:hypothetical protein
MNDRNQADQAYLAYLKKNREELMEQNPLPPGFWTEEFGIKQFRSHLANQERISRINYLADKTNGRTTQVYQEQRTP